MTGDTIKGDWRPTGLRRIEPRDIPRVVNGFGVPVEVELITLEQREMRRAVWEFVGYETRWETS